MMDSSTMDVVENMKNSSSEKRSAVCLFSGGLDSILAVCLLKEQGIPVHGIAYKTPFFGVDKAIEAAERMKMPLHIENFTATLIDVIEKPKHGFGGAMNPCIDCHTMMVRHAGKWMEENGHSFIITGEVLNERPMSQNKKALGIVAAESGYGNLLLRPLSALLLEETDPERKGWVNRNELAAIKGRSRAPQKELCRRFKITEYPQPAGGCKLTEKAFGQKVRDLRDNRELHDHQKVRLLKFGRHFRIGPNKYVVGRNHKENRVLEHAREKNDLLLHVEGFVGPTALMSGPASDENLKTAAAICARYSDCPSDQEVQVQFSTEERDFLVSTLPATPDAATRYMI